MKWTVVPLLFASLAAAHDVPDDVKVYTFFKPAGSKMQILVRMPADALIDILFPMLPGTPFLDLSQIDGYAKEGARVWIADLLSIAENGSPLPQPQIVAVRISQSGDGAFVSFDEALAHTVRDHLAPKTLLVQNQAELDVLLETPIQSEHSGFSLTPRFARVGVRVTTTLAFLPPSGGERRFQYEGNPEPFQLNPGPIDTLARFARSGFAQLFETWDYLLFLLAAALVLGAFRPALKFWLIFAFIQGSVLLAAAYGTASAPIWLAPLAATLVSVAIAYLGIEAIIPRNEIRWPIALAAGVVFGTATWFVLRSTLQFGGEYRLAAVLGFFGGLEASLVIALTVLILITNLTSRVLTAPRVGAMILAAWVLHTSWHEMIDRAQVLAHARFPW